MAGNFKLTQSVFLERVAALHPTLNFSDSIYVNAITDVVFQCPEHGEQHIKAGKLLEGRGCPKCGRRRSAEAGLVPWAKEHSMSEEGRKKAAERLAVARSMRTEEDFKKAGKKIAESQRQRWATDEAGKAAQSERAKKLAAEKWANTTPEERKAKMAAVRAAKQHHNGN